MIAYRKPSGHGLPIYLTDPEGNGIELKEDARA